MASILERLGLRPGRAPAEPEYDESRIHDDWFRAHYQYAAGVVGQWLGEVMRVEDANLLDFGCGDGITDLGVRLRFRPRSVTGVDVRPSFERLPAVARAQLGLRAPPAGLDFRRIEPGARLAGMRSTDAGPVDAIYSWSTFEHIDRELLRPVTADLFELLAPGGWFFLQIEPLYFSPFGSHLGRFVAQPWAHLTLDGNALWQAVRGHAGEIDALEKDLSHADHGGELGYKRFIFDEFLHLNRLTADELEALVTGVGFEIVRRERRRMEADLTGPIPDALAGLMDEDRLRTNEILLLLRKPAR